jgi:Ca2+-transporting ATPase
MGEGELSARTLAFTTLIVSNICLILTNRTWSRSIIASFRVPNRSLIGVVAGAIVFLLLVISAPPLQRLFHFEMISMTDMLICLGAGVLSVVWFELVKAIFIRMRIDLM